MAKALQAFLDFCYIVWHDVYDTESLEALQDALDQFHKHYKIFQTSGVCPNGFDLPRSHAAVHYMHLIWAFGAPNGLCSSIKAHCCGERTLVMIKSMERIKGKLTMNSCLDKLAATWVDFTSHGMFEGTVLDGVLNQIGKSDSILFLYRILIMLD